MLPRDDLDAAIDGVPWGDLDGARVLLTGGTGFFGIWLVESLLASGARAELVVLSRDPEAFLARHPHLRGRITLVPGDVRRFDATSAGGAFTHVVHGATSASAKLNEERPLEMIDVVVDGTRAVLAAVAEARPRVLLVSSGAIYGTQPPELPNVPETYAGAPDPLDLRAAYGHAKRLAEHVGAQYAAGGLPVTIARPFAFVGPYLPLDTHFAAGNFLRDALAGCAIVVRGDGTPVRTYMHAADLVRWLWTLLLRGEPGRAYNVGSERAVSIGELAAVVGAIGGVPFEIHGAPVPGARPVRYVPSTARAREELGLEQRIGLEDAFARTLRWLRAQRTV